MKQPGPCLHGWFISLSLRVSLAGGTDVMSGVGEPGRAAGQKPKAAALQGGVRRGKELSVVELICELG